MCPRTLPAAVALMVHLLAARASCTAAQHQQQQQQQQRLQCDDGAVVSFELLAGYAASPAAKHAMREQLALFTLPQCIAACKSDDQCAAITYETGACVSYAAASQQKNAHADFPLKRSQYPTHTATVARKICVRLPESCAQRSWSFDTVHGELKVAPRQHYKAISRSGCMDKCLNEKSFQCRSVNYNKETGDCYLNDVDRFAVSGRPAVSNRSADAAVDYMESNCAAAARPKACDFARLDGMQLRTADAIYENVATADRCRETCLASAEFRCRSFDHGETGANVCRISRHGEPAASPHRRPPAGHAYVAAAGATAYQTTSCLDVDVECRGADMVAAVRTDRLFGGKVYAKGRPRTCVNDVEGALRFELRLDYRGGGCDVRHDGPGKFSAEIIIQHHDQIVTGQDIGLSVRCSYDLQNRSVGHGIELAMAPAAGPDDPGVSDKGVAGGGGVADGGGPEETAFVISPTVMMRIANRAGGDVHAAQVGDPLSLRFHILDDGSPYEIFVRELIALDGVDASEILLIDGDGCPTDPTIMGPIATVDAGPAGTVTVLEAPFDAFKFPTSDIVQFKALVTPCLPKCEPVNCHVAGHNGSVRRVDSFGRRRRRREAGDRTDEVVFQEIRIEDRFEFDTRRGGGEVDFGAADREVVVDVAGRDWNAYAPALSVVVVFVVVFVLVQLSAAFACWTCAKRRVSRRDAAVRGPPTSWDENRYG